MSTAPDARHVWNATEGRGAVVLAAAGMVASVTGFALFLYDVTVMPPQAGSLMVMSWSLMGVAIGMAAWAMDRLPRPGSGRDFAVGALRTTCALPLVILFLVVIWILLYAAVGGG